MVMKTVWEAQVFSTGVIVFLIVSLIVILYCTYFLIKSRSTPEWGVGKIVCIVLIAVLALINLQSIKAMAPKVLGHRLNLTAEAKIVKENKDEILKSLIRKAKIPL